MKVKELFSKVKNELGSREAEQIITGVLGKDRSYIYAHGEDELEAEAAGSIEKALERREGGEPLQYILNSADFMGLELYVDERVLIPRPETELLCEEAKKALVFASTPCDPEKCTFCFRKDDCDSMGNPEEGQERLKILDVCTGSGAIALYLATEFPDADVTASDISADALDVCRINFKDRPVSLVQSDLFEKLTGKYDLITANPPYIPAKVVEELDPVVRDYEPHLALDGGASGFEIPLRLVKEAFSHLKPNGTLLMEIGDDQGARALEAAANTGFRSCRIIKDYADQDRILVVSL